MGKITLKGQKKKTWSACSRYVRHKHSKDGLCTCFTCGVVKPIAEMQAGHAIQGRGNSILFQTDAIRPQCSSCNVWQGGRLDVFIPKLIDEIGRERYDEILEMKGNPRKFTLEELKDMQRDYELLSKG